MPAAGEYDLRLKWLLCVKDTDPATGDEVLTHVDNGYLWCAVEEQTGTRADGVGATQTGVQVTIRVRNYPSLKTVDLLHHEFNDYVYHIESIYNGDDELICDGYRDDDLVDFNIEEDS